MAAQQATEIRRRLAEVEADQAALRARQTELEKFLLAAPASTWREAAEKAQYPIALLAATLVGRDPRRQQLIASILDDLRRLSGQPGASSDGGESEASVEPSGDLRRIPAVTIDAHRVRAHAPLADADATRPCPVMVGERIDRIDFGSSRESGDLSRTSAHPLLTTA